MTIHEHTHSFFWVCSKSDGSQTVDATQIVVANVFIKSSWLLKMDIER
jgi:hypothetical protein